MPDKTLCSGQVREGPAGEEPVTSGPAGRWSLRHNILLGALVASSTALTLAVRSDGPLPGEVATARWMNQNTPAAVDRFADLIDPALTDMAAPVVFVAIALLVWWRWGRYSAVMLGFAGAFTGLTRLGDLVERPRPTPAVEWSGYSFGNGGYPSGHVVFSVLVLGTVALLARRQTTSRIARWIVGAMSILIAVTSWTRVSRLEHWPLDVVGGSLMAAAGLLGITWLHPRLASLATGRPLLGRLLLAPGTSYSTAHPEV